MQGLGALLCQVCDECLVEFCDGICSKVSFDDFKVYICYRTTYLCYPESRKLFSENKIDQM